MPECHVLVCPRVTPKPPRFDMITEIKRTFQNSNQVEVFRDRSSAETCEAVSPSSAYIFSYW